MFKRKYLLIAVAVGTLSACAGKPFDYHPIDEMKQGPGVFTTEEDGLTLFDTESRNSGNNTGADVTPNAEIADFREFQEYQKWRRHQGKREEQIEFKEWREWKEYKEWKAQQQ